MTSTTANTAAQERQFLRLEAIHFDFKEARPDHRIEVTIKVDDEFKDSQLYSRRTEITWKKTLYISTRARIDISIHKVRLGVRTRYSSIAVDLKAARVSNENSLKASDEHQDVLVTLIFGPSLDSKRVLDLFGTDVNVALDNKVTILDRIAKVSIFAEKVIDITAKAVELGTAISEVNSTAKAAFEIAAFAFNKLQHQRDFHHAAVDLLVTITTKLPLADIIPENMRSPQIGALLQVMLNVMARAMRFLVDYAQTPTYKDLLSSQLGTIVDLKEKLNDALANFHVGLSAQHVVAMQESNERIKEANERAKEANKLVQEQKQMEGRKKLNPVAAAQFSQGASCIDGTREIPLGQIMIWSEGTSPSATFWVHGLAGSGKSTIATTVCERLREKKALAGSFFCKRDAHDQRDPKRILSSLSYSLTNHCKPYRDLICAALENETDISASPVTYQLSPLFTTPFAALKNQNDCPRESLIFVVDALDECGDDTSRSQIANCLCQIAVLADWLKVVVTSRPQPLLAQAFLSRDRHRLSLDLNTLDSTSDIAEYTRSSLQELVDSQKLDGKWLNNKTIATLSTRASGLFIWSTTMISFLQGQLDKDYAMEVLLEGQSADAEKNLDALYMTVIGGGNLDGLNVELKRAFLAILRITAKNEPLSINALCDFMPLLGSQRKVKKSTLRAAFDLLQSVLYEDASNGNAIRVCHPSFLDFLESSQRCGVYWTDPKQLQQTMIENCFNIMRIGLRLNICNMKSSFIGNSEISDLQQKIRQNIPESLQYSCLHWFTHFIESSRTIVEHLVADFFGGMRILFWLEVLSLIGGLEMGLYALQRILDVYHDRPEIRKIALDAYKFVSSSYDTISHSTPHLYASAMTWLPEESPLRLLLYPYFRNQPLFETGRHKEWHRARWMRAMNGQVLQVAFAHDGRYVAAHSDDGTVCIWETWTGLMVSMLKCPCGKITCIAFSPITRQLAYGSIDDKVVIFDLGTGREVACMTRCYSLCYSPDGKFIATCSWDATARIWDSNTGKEIRTLAGRLKYGKITYSPDGCKIAYCGNDSIKVYSTKSRELLGEVHGVKVSCMAYSPNGALLATGGEDWTVRIWNEETLSEVAALKKHRFAVLSVAFSPDGSELLSASRDATLIRWVTASFQIADPPFRAHEGRIHSAVYSPDGRFIASGSMDNTVRMWDVHSISNDDSSNLKVNRVYAVSCSPGGKEFASTTTDGIVRIHDLHSGAVLRTLSGHSDEVSTVAYSPNGESLASGSHDGVIVIWNAETGTEMQKLLGHASRVSTVIFTSDGQHVISVSEDHTVRRWRVNFGDGEVISSHTDKMWVACLSPDGKLLVSSGEDKIVRFSDPVSGADVGLPYTAGTVTLTLAFSPNGKYIALGSTNNVIRIWDVKNREEVKILTGHTSAITSAAFSPDEKQLTSSSSDSTIRQWDLETGAELRKLCGHTYRIRSIAYSIDGKRIISGSEDGTVRIWSTDLTRNGYVAELDQELPSLPLIDGWIRSRKGDLLLWVPPEYRNGIRDMCEVCIPADAPGHPVRLDWSRIANDEGWTSILKVARA